MLRMSFSQSREKPGQQRFICHHPMFAGVDIINNTFKLKDMHNVHAGNTHLNITENDLPGKSQVIKNN